MKQAYKRAVSRDLPATHMMNPERTWIPAEHTNIADTFARIRDEQAIAKKQYPKLHFLPRGIR